MVVQCAANVHVVARDLIVILQRGHVVVVVVGVLRLWRCYHHQQQLESNDFVVVDVVVADSLGAVVVSGACLVEHWLRALEALRVVKVGIVVFVVLVD